MRLNRIVVLSIALLALVLSPAALADCGSKHNDAEQASETKPCCAKMAKAELKDCCKEAGGRENCETCNAMAELTANAEAGCSKSAAKLIAMAKKSDSPETAALAAKAEQGDKEAMAALMAKSAGSRDGHHNAETAMLAANAKAGCSKSAAKLMAAAKKSGCPKSAALVAKAESGDKEARAELIAMFAEADSAE